MLEDELISMAPTLLKHLISLSSEMGSFVRDPFLLLLQELKYLSLQNFAEIVELMALIVRSAEAALDIMLGILEPESSRLLIQRPFAVGQFIPAVFGCALDHIDEASASGVLKEECLTLSQDDFRDGSMVVKSALRVDSSLSGLLKVGDHVRLTAANIPKNDAGARLFSMDALVLTADSGTVTFRCIHHPPTYLEQCAWSITYCRSFISRKTSLDAVTAFYTEREACCRIYLLVLGLPSSEDHVQWVNVELPVALVPSLNVSQNAALKASMKHPLTFIWGLPGTGKTHTVVAILSQLLNALSRSRFLVCAPTHNAIDNLMRRFVSDADAKKSGVIPIRVSTQVRATKSRQNRHSH